MLGSVGLSAAGVGYAVFFGVVADGGRGGALAVALTFAMLFLGRGTAEAALEVNFPRDDGDLDSGLEAARVRNALASMFDWQTKEKRYLTIASVVGTLVWGFGDVLAALLGARP